MTKLVLKTVAITLVAVLGACLIAFGSLALFAPASVANFFDGLGFYKPAIHYYEKQYGKSESIEDLAVLILKLDDDKDSIKTEEYTKILIEHPDYATYCQMKDGVNQGSTVTANEFYISKYAVALVRNDKFITAIDTAKDFVDDYGYTAYNPFSVIISELGLTLDIDKLEEIEERISEYLNSANGDVVATDIARIKQLLDNN
ncbi:MAG: hypothetical protein IJX16_01670 [Clostridia bacterium]|nr:hypothetical protein [Clostridia bacterium]